MVQVFRLGSTLLVRGRILHIIQSHNPTVPRPYISPSSGFTGLFVIFYPVMERMRSLYCSSKMLIVMGLLVKIVKVLFSFLASVYLVYLAFEHKADFLNGEMTFLMSMAGGGICLSYFFNGLRRLVMGFPAVLIFLMPTVLGCI